MDERSRRWNSRGPNARIDHGQHGFGISFGTALPLGAEIGRIAEDAVGPFGQRLAPIPCWGVTYRSQHFEVPVQPSHAPLAQLDRASVYGTEG